MHKQVLTVFIVFIVFVAASSACLYQPDSDSDSNPDPDPNWLHPEQIMLNQLPLRSILINTLIGTRDSLEALTSHSLSSETFAVDTEHDLGRQLIQPEAQMFIDYLAGCALSPTDPAITWDHPQNPYGPQTWHGELGLCPEWAYGPPSAECLQLISACLLASENAFGYSVTISQRGRDLNGQALPTTDPIKVKTTTTAEGLPVASFEPCADPNPDPTRNCGWTADRSYVGACEPGTNLALQCLPDSPSGAVRICAGHTGCDSQSPQVLAQSAGMCDTHGEIAFYCPDTGTYAAMVAGSNGLSPAELELSASTGSFPATEREVFQRREGAYFGTIFDPGERLDLVSAHVDEAGQIQVTIPADDGLYVVNEAMWSCHALDWIDPEAYALHRLCTVVTDSNGNQATLCAAQSLGACRANGVDKGSVCELDDAPPILGDGDFGGCTDPRGTAWPQALTVFLDGACDLYDFRPHGPCDGDLL